MSFNALRTRLAAWAGALATLVALAVAASFYAESRGALIESLDESLESRARSIAAIARAAGREASPGEPAGMRPFAGADPSHGYDVRRAANLEVLVSSNPGLQTASPFTDAELARLVAATRTAGARRPRLIDTRPFGELAAVRSLATVFPGPNAPTGSVAAARIVVIVFEDFAEIESELDEMLARLLGVSVLGAALGIAGAWALARSIARPIEAIARAAEGIREGSTCQRVPEPGTGDEVDRLAGALNGALSRLESAYARQSQFTSDAAHELRTPVSIVLSTCEVALRQPRSVEEYRCAIEASIAAALRMSDLIEGLLLLARSDAGAVLLRRELIDVADLARSVTTEFTALPASANHTIVVRTVGTDFSLQGDAGLLAVLLRNLLSNAVTHSGRPCAIAVVVRAHPDWVELLVRDDGIGIPRDVLPHVFERFFRGDPSRSRATGGSGLGLTIARRIAILHQGDTTVVSAPGQGCSIRATLRRGGDPVAHA